MNGESKGKRRWIRGWSEYPSPKPFFRACYFSLYDSDNDDIREQRRGWGLERGVDGHHMRLDASAFFFFTATHLVNRGIEIEDTRGAPQ